ncbi:MAG: DUF927 domain-containing protein [Anaerolineales bacterium]|nr:DUF927 domain-containing protein [Anaerolineales bacterium]
MSRIPDKARVAPGATFTGWQTWSDAAIDAALDQIRNDPSDNPNGRNTKVFAGMCQVAELVHGGHITIEEASQQVHQATKARHDHLADKEIERQWRNALKRTSGKPRLYQPATSANGSAPAPAVDEELKAGYHIEAGRLVLVEYKANGEQVVKPLADIGAQIKQVATAEDGQRTYTLIGKGWRSGRFELDIAAEDFESDAKLRALIGSHCPLDPIYPRMSQHLPAAVKSVTNGQISYTSRYHRTGWQGQTFLVPGLEPDQTEIHLASDLPYSVAGGELADGLTALESLINALDTKLTTVVLAAIFGAPLLHKLGLRNRRYGVFIVGRTGSLKTAWTTTAMSVYGAGHVTDEQYIKWGQGATQNAMMKLASMATDLPLLIDNYKPNTGGGGRAFVNLMHAIIEGGEKKRLNRNSDLRESADIYTLPIFTGEALPGLDAAALARLLPIEFPWAGGEINEPLNIAQVMADDLPAVGRRWIQYIMQSDFSEMAELYDDERRTWAKWLMTHHKEMQNKLRVASNMAINSLSWRILCDAPDGLGEVAGRYAAEHRLGLGLAAAMLTTSTDTALEATRFLSGLSQLVATGRVIIPDIADGDAVLSMDRDRLIGWRDGELCYLLPDLALGTYRRQLDDRLNEYDTNSIGRQLDALGHLARTSAGRNQYHKRIFNERHWVWCLHSNLLWAQDDPEPLGAGVGSLG